ncbi:MAG: YbjQ family protein [Zoogloeaceae bacterium]|nr:YbjQ family protein [Zoogloeaceae bacterium]
MGELFAIAIFFVLLIVGYVFGSIDQNRHYRSIKTRERKYRHIFVFNEKRPPADFAGQRFALVCGSVVMGSDYFRQFVASLKKLFGGRLSSFEAMLDRGRREAILRMKEQAQEMGAKAIFNVRLETSTLSNLENRESGLACVELVAYGTAWCPPPEG